VLAAALLAISAAQAQVIDPELEEQLTKLGPQDHVSVIVRFADRVGLSQFHETDKALLRSDIVAALKAQSYASQSAVEHLLASPSVARRVSLWGINGLALTASPQVVAALANNPNVARISFDAVVQALPTAPNSPAVPEWNLSAIHAPEMWTAGYTGAGVVVGGMDTGVDVFHPDLAATYRGGSNSWFDPYGQHATPTDISGHGTQSMGLIVGGSAGGTAIGVAPGASWIAAKIFNDAGSASLSAIHAAFQWMLDPDGNSATNDGADVVNNSWTLSNAGGCNLEFEQDLQTLKAAQVAVVFAGGNFGPYPSSSVSPSNNPSGFAVGSIDQSSLIDSTSSTGPSACDGAIYPEVVAPGVSVRTADLTYGGVFPDSYTSVSGTSFAAPHVAGGIAVLLSAYPNATVADLQQSLMDTAVDLGAIGADNEYGYGEIDLVAAGDWLANPPGPTCTDDDGDGFFVQSGCGTPLDCNDFDPGINPAACDIKNDGIDQDCDGVDRTKGKPCPVTGNPPTAVDDAYTVAEDAAGGLVVAAPGVLGNDSLGDGPGPLVASLASSVSSGTLALGADGSLTYTPATNFNGTDHFSYTANDGLLDSAPATVAITVTPVNDPPTAVADTASTAFETPVIIAVAANDSDVDGNLDPASVAVVASPAHGTAQANGDGTVTYTPANGYSGSDAFSYEICDTDLLCATAAVSVTVTTGGGGNSPPTAVDDAASTSKNTAVTFSVTANDVDPDGTIDVTTVTLTSGGITSKGGTVVANGDGTVTYTPKRNFRGDDSFTYTVKDDLGATSNVATVTVTVSR